MFDFIKTAYAAAAPDATPPATPTIPVEEITTQVGVAVSGIINVVMGALPVLMVIFATIIGLYLVLRLVGKVSKGK